MDDADTAAGPRSADERSYVLLCVWCEGVCLVSLAPATALARVCVRVIACDQVLDARCRVQGMHPVRAPLHDVSS